MNRIKSLFMRFISWISMNDEDKLEKAMYKKIELTEYLNDPSNCNKEKTKKEIEELNRTIVKLSIGIKLRDSKYDYWF